MSGLVAVASREMRERRFILVAALVAGLLPLLLHVVGGTPARGAEWLAFVVLLAFPAAVGIVLGSSVLGRDLAERRLGFYFVRPISAGAIWGGKMLAAAVLTVATTALLATLTFRFFQNGFPLFRSSATLTMILVGSLPLVGLVAAHIGASLFRSRSGLLAYDCTAFLASLIAFGLMAKRLADAGALSSLQYVVPALAILMIPVLVLAGAAQVIIGRTDARRGHFALSATLWGLVAAQLGAVAFFAHWVLSVTPAELEKGRWRQWAWAYVDPAPVGDYFFLNGGRAGYNPLFLINAATGRYVRVGVDVQGAAFSADGRHAVWLEGLSAWAASHSRVLATARLDGAQPVITRSPLEKGDSIKALSQEGSRVLLREGELIHVRETVSGGPVAKTKLGEPLAASFLTPGKVRIYQTLIPGRRTIVVTDWDLGTGSMIERLRIANQGFIRVEGVRGSQLLVKERPQAGAPLRLAVYDVETARERVVLEGLREMDLAAWLQDGRVAVTSGDGPTRLRIFDDAGHETLSTELPARTASWGGELGGRLILGSVDLTRKPAVESLFVDLQTGAVNRRMETLSPIYHLRFTGYIDPTVVATADSLGPRIFRDAKNSLVLLDPSTGDYRPLLSAMEK
jgi:hypothetical protein